LLFAFVLALLASAVAPAVARASCGDWLADHAAPASDDASRAAGHHSPMLPLAPCHGPECRRAPLPLTPPAPQQDRVPSERDAALAASDEAIDERPLNPWTLTSDAPAADGYTSPLERPPRAATIARAA
jgi:hypothetical protein